MKNSFLKTALLFTFFMTAWMTFFKSMEGGGFSLDSLLHGFLSGACSGLFYGLIIKYTPIFAYKNLKLTLDPGELVIKVGGASHLTHSKFVNGKLAVTQGRLIFRLQKYGKDTQQLSFDYDQMENIRAVKSWLLLKNEVRFDYPAGTTQRFGVDDPHLWVQEIENQRGHSVHAEPIHS